MTGRHAPAGAGLLDAMVAAARTTVAERRARVPLARVVAAGARRAPRAALFRQALATPGRLNVIAECKRRSPARGVLMRDYRPADLARAYQAGGAAAISVLTEPAFFDGALAHLEAVRAAVTLPILRKDFIIDEYQLVEARAAGADAVLLIVAALAADELAALAGRATELGLATLVEVHTGAELDVAVASGAPVIGVNSRNLQTLDVDLAVCEDLIARIPPGTIAVAESGVKSREDAKRLQACGYHACLVGERLMRASNPAAELAAWADSRPPADAEKHGGGGRH